MANFSDEFAFAFDIMLFIFGVIELIAVAVLTVFVIWYIKKLDKTADLLSVTTFGFIIIGVIIRIVPVLTIMVLVH